jgi:arylsulfatase A-like enzyme
MESGSGSSHPNLLLVFADQMRYTSLGCTGNDEAMTPQLDAFAGEGALLTNAVSTCAVCVPFRASLLTGRYPLSSTVFTNNIRLPNDMPSMGKMLKAAGYDTAYIGKWHLAGEPATEGFVPPGPMRHGFDYWAVHNCSHKYWDAVYYRDEPVPITIPGWEPDRQTDLAIEFLCSRALSRPFALVVSWGPPHTPFIAPPEYEALHDPESVKLRPNVEMRDWLRFGDDRQYRGPHPNPDPETVLRDFTARYRAAVTNLDHNFGRLLGTLEELHLTQDTVVVFTSDHGEMLGSHGQLHKLQPWDESVRVPLLIRYPGVVAPGSRPDAPVGTPDILPTLLGLAGLEVPAGVEGENLSGVLRGQASKGPRSALLACIVSSDTWGQRWTDCAQGGWGYPPGFLRPYRGVRTRTHTYVRDRTGPWFLYDNERDPYQLDNLVESSGPDAVPLELDRELDEWLDRTGDFFGGNDEYQRHVDVSTGLVTRPQALMRV